jgi:hypothetical protein
MKLYKLSQSRNTGWYTYDSAIVAATSKEAARKILPSPFYIYDDGTFYYRYKHQELAAEATDPSWCDPKYVKAELIGTTDLPAGVVSSSYNAGFDESRYLDLRRMKVIARHHHSNSKRAMAEHTITQIERQLKDRGLAELRYHLIEANRTHDQAKSLEYELKIRDYMGEEHEDWS